MVVGRRYERIESVEYLRRSSSRLGGGYRVDRLLSDYPVEKELFNEGDQPSPFWRANLKTSFGTPRGRTVSTWGEASHSCDPSCSDS